MNINKINQIGNIADDKGRGFKNPQNGRIYSSDGIAPTLSTCGGGSKKLKYCRRRMHVQRQLDLHILNCLVFTMTEIKIGTRKQSTCVRHRELTEVE